MEWTCPYCKEQNDTENPDLVLQCSWCMKKVQADTVRDVGGREDIRV